MISNDSQVAASFRDPSGFMFRRGGGFYRQVNKAYREDFDYLTSSMLLEQLFDESKLVRHVEVAVPPANQELCYKVIQPETVPFISYPYEWSFSQLKHAALLTLDVQQAALDKGMTLKDCSAYNVQFLGSQPIFIDTLSFKRYHEGEPWTPYRQFCEHFLAPLALMSAKDVGLNQLLRTNVEGVPLELARKLLPFHSKFTLSLGTHVHLHARSLRKHSDRLSSADRSGKTRLSRFKFLALLDSLRSAIQRMRWQPAGTEWADYYQDTNYSSDGLKHKERLVRQFLDTVAPQSVWDLGANTGFFSRAASQTAALTVAFDIDPACVERNYLAAKQEGTTKLLPLLMDLTNPSPGIGWNNQERMSLWERGPVNLVLALALIHHLAISNNLPFRNIAQCFQQTADWLIVEFVPKADSQVQRLLASREDIFSNYDESGFETAFSEYFTIVKREKIRDSHRTLYLLRRRQPA